MLNFALFSETSFADNEEKQLFQCVILHSIKHPFIKSPSPHPYRDAFDERLSFRHRVVIHFTHSHSHKDLPIYTFIPSLDGCIRFNRHHNHHTSALKKTDYSIFDAQRQTAAAAAVGSVLFMDPFHCFNVLHKLGIIAFECVVVVVPRLLFSCVRIM